MKTILIDAVHTLVVKDHGLNQDLVSLLDHYDEPKLIATNANDEEIKEYGIDEAPYEIFTLKHNPNKIDPKYFSELLRIKDLSKNDILYIEHDLEAVESARTLGIVSYHYDSVKMDIQGVKMFLDENIRPKNLAIGEFDDYVL